MEIKLKFSFKWGAGCLANIIKEIVVTNIVASQLPKWQLTAMLTTFRIVMNR